ncbi:hypothetical protein FH972_015514 [Carpinus fangiana]|uniref:HMA domain-containing protein n=1 Tax=Carpinus fangiana TaxID=176857 RepID=A0A5N6RDA8_9ROSI|nr:hypothetical protein FH972_015514 [Carpinus fangiana]
MYCNACERTVAKAISKCKGVEKFTTDMNKHKVMVMGRFDPQKVVKKLKKKTGKRVEIVENTGKTPTASINGQDLVPDPPMFDYCKETQLLMMFSDENPNACSIM